MLRYHSTFNHIGILQKSTALQVVVHPSLKHRHCRGFFRFDIGLPCHLQEQEPLGSLTGGQTMITSPFRVFPFSALGIQPFFVTC